MKVVLSGKTDHFSIILLFRIKISTVIFQWRARLIKTSGAGINYFHHSIEILGIQVDNNLKFTKQINQIKKRAMNVTRQIHRINYFLPMDQRVMLYNTVIAPLFNYGDVIWGGCDEKDSKSLQKVQNFAARSICGRRKYDSASQSLKELRLLDLKTRRKVHEAVFAHKAVSNKTAENTCKIFENYKPLTQTRHANAGKLNIPSHTYAKYKKCPTYRCIKTWNTLPKGLPEDDIRKHKKAHQKYLIEKYYPQKT